MSHTPTIDLHKDLKQADEQAQLRAALRGWLAERAKLLPRPLWRSDLELAAEYLETVARRLEGM